MESEASAVSIRYVGPDVHKDSTDIAKADAGARYGRDLALAQRRSLP